MAMDPVGKEDKDVDNDGKVTKADKYLMARRRAIAKRMKEEVEQIDEISTELKKRYVEKGAEDVVDRFTGRGKYERPRNPAHFTKTGRVKKSALNRPEAIKYREKLDNRRDIVNKVSQEVHGKKRFGEEVELDEAQIKKPTKTEREIALVDGSPNSSAKMGVNKLAYKLANEPKKKVSLPKAPWNEETELGEGFKYANIDLKDVKATLDAHRATGEAARHLGGGKIAYTGKSLTKPNNQ